jgi:acetoin:2,6-dichlorophenolindophenol oxidoreductase subunit alpha
MDARYTPDLLAGLYGQMVLIRRFEERVARLYSEGLIKGSTHLCIGQEATAVGGCAAIEPKDYLTCTYRGHGQCLAKGLDPKAAMAEILGRVTGCCKGRGGSMHLTDVGVGLLGENGIVGGGIAIACGAAFSAKLLGNGLVALTYFGEGATNQGVAHESLNLAAIWELPVIFFCENNLYAEMTPIATTVKVPSMCARARGNGVPAVEIDGNDVLAVYRAVDEAAERARAGGGPTFIEAHTYRFCGHMEGDREPYRSKEEVEDRRRGDPIARFRAALLKEHGMDPQIVERLDTRALSVVDEAESFARSSPFPDPAHLAQGVYA